MAGGLQLSSPCPVSSGSPDKLSRGVGHSLDMVAFSSTGRTNCFMYSGAASSEASFFLSGRFVFRSMLGITRRIASVARTRVTREIPLSRFTICGQFHSRLQRSDGGGQIVSVRVSLLAVDLGFACSRGNRTRRSAVKPYIYGGQEGVRSKRRRPHVESILYRPTLVAGCSHNSGRWSVNGGP